MNSSECTTTHPRGFRRSCCQNISFSCPAFSRAWAYSGFIANFHSFTLNRKIFHLLTSNIYSLELTSRPSTIHSRSLDLCCAILEEKRDAYFNHGFAHSPKKYLSQDHLQVCTTNNVTRAKNTACNLHYQKRQSYPFLPSQIICSLFYSALGP